MSEQTNLAGSFTLPPHINDREILRRKPFQEHAAL
jgi:hypothetical protein